MRTSRRQSKFPLATSQKRHARHENTTLIDYARTGAPVRIADTPPCIFAPTCASRYYIELVASTTQPTHHHGVAPQSESAKKYATNAVDIMVGCCAIAAAFFAGIAGRVAPSSAFTKMAALFYACFVFAG